MPILVMLMVGAGGALCQSTIGLTSLTIQVLDARTGKPVPANHILFFTGTTAQDLQFHQGHLEAITDADGLATLTLDSRQPHFAQVWIDFHSRCQKHPNFESLSLDQIRDRGLVLNDCSKLTKELIPNHVTVYVRPETIAEKMRH
jgi:hypothetical protein